MSGQRTHPSVICQCEICGVSFHPPKSSVGADFKLLPGTGRFCSHKCCGLSRRGESRPLWDRFWEKVNKDGPLCADSSLGNCWVFGPNPDANHRRIGSVGVRSPILVHRLSYEWEFGSISDGLIVRHRCDRRCCVRPSHLCLGTTKENADDWVSRGPGVVIPNSPRVPTPVAERLWAKIDKNGPIPSHRPELGACWVWMGAKDTKGYGKLRMVADGKKTTRPAHRIAYELDRGPVPDGLIILHECDHPPCCNVAHLTPGTHQQNMQDKIAKSRANQTHKLSDEDIQEMRKRHGLGESQRSLTSAFRVCQAVVSVTVRRLSHTGVK